MKIRPLLFAATSLFSLQPAYAQTTTDETDGGVQEIVVTANRRSEKAQDIPASITAIGGDQLAQTGIQSSTDLQRQVPNLIFNQSYAASNPQIFIRGVGVNDFNSNASTAVGIYVDDIYLSSPSTLSFQLFDIDRVEVLRGPQGTLYGRNTTGGAINFISKRPTASFEGDATIRYGRFNERTLEAAVGGPIVPDLLQFRIAGTLNKRDGVTDNRVGGSRVNDRDNWGLRGQLEWLLGGDSSLLLNAHVGQNRSGATQYQDRGLLESVGPGVSPILAAVAAGTAPARCTVAATRAFQCVDGLGYRDSDNGNRDSGEYNLLGQERLGTYGFSGTLNVDLGGLKLTSITGYENVKLDRNDNTDGNPLQLLEIRWTNQSHQFSQELRLASPGGDRFNWIIGGYYFDEQTSARNSYDSFRELRPTLEVALGASGGFVPGLAFVADQQYRQSVQAYAAFGQADYALADKLKLTVGVRYTHERRQFAQTVDFVEPGFTISVVDYPARSPTTGDRGIRSVGRVTGSATLSYDFSDDVLGYATFARGFKSGGYNGGVVFQDAAVRSFRPETLTSYEIGLKSTFLDRKLRLNLSGFYYDYKDLQVFTLVNTGGVPTQIIDNAPKSRVYGFEADLTARPTEALTVTAGVGVLSAKLVSYQAFDGINSDGTDRFVDRSGNRLVGAPSLTLNGSIAYAIGFGDGLTLTPSVDARYQSSIFYDTANNPRLSQGGYGIVNARLTLASDKGWHIAAFGRNITNTKYLTAAFDLADFGFDQLTFGDRPTFGVEAGIKF